jgi:hypothetical protein
MRVAIVTKRLPYKKKSNANLGKPDFSAERAGT